jgi:uncharacterized Zn finger protein (UPF0148 family)
MGKNDFICEECSFCKRPLSGDCVLNEKTILCGDCVKQFEHRMKNRIFPLKKREVCPHCSEILDVFFVPDGRIICPKCFPEAVYKRWENEWKPIERAWLKEIRRIDAEQKKLKKQKFKEEKRLILDPDPKQEAYEQLEIKDQPMETKNNVCCEENGPLFSPILIKCPACGGHVSNQSEMCLKCGQPIARKNQLNENKPIQTVELTDKQWKAGQLLGCLVMFLPFLLCGINAVAFYIACVGFTILLFSSIAAWWHNG